MTTRTLTIGITAIKREFEALVWKYANTIEGADNGKAVHNVKSDRVDDALDSMLVDNNYNKRVKEIVSMMNDFSPTSTTSGDNTVITFANTSRWDGAVATMESLVRTYLLDGMMIDWLNVTAPSEAAIYATRLSQDATDIKVELYKKGAPL